MSMPEGVSRSKVWLLGLDQVAVSGVDKIRQVLDSGDVERLSSSLPLKDLPLWARIFFPVTAFFSPNHGWFLPFISETDATYPPCRRFLDHKFATRGFLDEDVTAAADLFTAEEPASDDALFRVFAQAVQRYFTPDKPLPDSIYEAANKQIITPDKSFVPWSRWQSASGTGEVYRYTDASRKDISGTSALPDRCVTDIAHVVLALQQNAPPALRAIAADLDTDPEVLLARAGPVMQSTVPRIVKRGGTLGGLLPEDDPAVPGKTVVILNIASAALATDDPLWAFGSGTKERACAALPALLDYTRSVQAELRRRRDAAAA